MRQTKWEREGKSAFWGSGGRSCAIATAAWKMWDGFAEKALDGQHERKGKCVCLGGRLGGGSCAIATAAWKMWDGCAEKSIRRTT
eukprot:353529-Chlamydomonas_euryale.AAC.13